MKALRSQHSLLLSLALTIAAVTLVGGYVWSWITRLSDVAMQYDEAIHAYHVTRAASQLAAGQLWQFIQIGLSQVAYPPGYSWLAAPFVIWLGAELITLRGLSLLWLLLSALVAWRAASSLARRRPGLAGLLAGLLVLTSAPLVLFASHALIDSAGLLSVFITLYWWGQLRAESPVWRAVCAGALAGVTLLIKYPFGVFIGATLGVATVIDLIRRRSWRRQRNDRWLLGSAASVVGIYLLLPGRLSDLTWYSTLQPRYAEFWTAGNLFYYGQSLVTQYAVSPLIGAIVLILVSLALFIPRRQGLFRWALYFWVGYAILTLKLENKPRHAYVVLPAAFVVAAVLFADGFDGLIRLASDRISTGLSVTWGALQVHLISQPRWGRWQVSALTLVLVSSLLTSGFLSLRRRVQTFPVMLAMNYRADASAALDPANYVSSPNNLSDLYAFVSRTIDDPAPRVIVLQTINELNTPAVGWRLAADRLGAPGMGTLVWPEFAYESLPDDFAAFRARLIAENISYIVIFRDARWGPVHWGSRSLTWYLRHDLEFIASDLFTLTIIEDDVTVNRLLANHDFGPPELEGRIRGLSKEWPHVVDVLHFVPDGFQDNPLPDLYGMLDIPHSERNYELPQPGVPIEATFDDKVTLVGYDIRRNGGQAELKLYWQSQTWMNEDYHVFIHLLDPASDELLFGHDFTPRPEYPIQWWAPREVVEDTVTLDISGVPPGQYRLGLGIYDFETMQRLPAETTVAAFADGWLPLDEAFILE